MIIISSFFFSVCSFRPREVAPVEVRDDVTVAHQWVLFRFTIFRCFLLCFYTRKPHDCSKKKIKIKTKKNKWLAGQVVGVKCGRTAPISCFFRVKVILLLFQCQPHGTAEQLDGPAHDFPSPCPSYKKKGKWGWNWTLAVFPLRPNWRTGEAIWMRPFVCRIHLIRFVFFFRLSWWRSPPVPHVVDTR